MLYEVPSNPVCVECNKPNCEWYAIDYRAGLGVCIGCAEESRKPKDNVVLFHKESP